MLQINHSLKNQDQFINFHSLSFPVFNFVLSLSLLVLIFSVAPRNSVAHIDLTTPSGPTTVYARQYLDISWDVYIDHGAGIIKIEYSSNGGTDWNLITDGLPYSGPADQFGSYLWLVPDLDSADGRIRVTYEADGGGTYINEITNPIINFTTISTIEVVLEELVNSYAGTKDATLYGGTDNANGGGEYIFAGNTNTSVERRALIAFDLSSIPTGSVVLSAELQLTVSKTATGDSTQTLHRLISDWGEGTADATGDEGQGTTAIGNDATWNSNFHGTSLWTSPGAAGDFITDASSTATVGLVGTTATWTGIQIYQDVQDWINGVNTNFGWILIGDESTNMTAKRFHSSESTTATTGQRPRLIVNLQAPSGISPSVWIQY